MTKKIAVYGTYEARVPVKQRVWKRRKDGVRQRYWTSTKRTKKVQLSGRYEFRACMHEGFGQENQQKTMKKLRFQTVLT